MLTQWAVQLKVASHTDIITVIGSTSNNYQFGACVLRQRCSPTSTQEHEEIRRHQGVPGCFGVRGGGGTLSLLLVNPVERRKPNVQLAVSEYNLVGISRWQSREYNISGSSTLPPLQINDRKCITTAEMPQGRRSTVLGCGSNLQLYGLR